MKLIFYKAKHINKINFKKRPPQQAFTEQLIFIFGDCHHKDDFSILLNLRKLYGPFLWMRFNCLKASHFQEAVYFLPISSHLLIYFSICKCSLSLSLSPGVERQREKERDHAKICLAGYITAITK